MEWKKKKDNKKKGGELPFDCLIEIGRFLSIDDLNQFRLACKEFNQVIELFKRFYFFKKPIKSLSRFINNKKRCNMVLSESIEKLNEFKKSLNEFKEIRIKLILKEVLRIEYFDIKDLDATKHFYFNDVIRINSKEKNDIENRVRRETYFIFQHIKTFYCCCYSQDSLVWVKQNDEFYKFVNIIKGVFFC